MTVFSKGPGPEYPEPTPPEPGAALRRRTFCVVLAVCLLGGFEAFEWTVQNCLTWYLGTRRAGILVSMDPSVQYYAIQLPRARLVLRGVLVLLAFAQLCRWLRCVKSSLEDPSDLIEQPGRSAKTNRWRLAFAVLRHPWRGVADIVTLDRRGQTLIVLWWLLWGAYLLCSLALVAVTCSIGVPPRVPLTDMRLDWLVRIGRVTTILGLVASAATIVLVAVVTRSWIDRPEADGP